MGPSNDDTLNKSHLSNLSGLNGRDLNSFMKKQLMEPLIEFEIKEHEILDNNNYVVSIPIIIGITKTDTHTSLA